MVLWRGCVMPVIMSVMSVVAMATMLILQLMLHRIRDRRTCRRAQQRLEFTALANLVAQSTTRAAAYDGSDEALVTVGLLLLVTVGGWWCAAVLCLSWWSVAVHVPGGGGVLWLLGCVVAVALLLRVSMTCAVVICCRHFGSKF